MNCQLCCNASAILITVHSTLVREAPKKVRGGGKGPAIKGGKIDFLKNVSLAIKKGTFV